MSDLKIQVLNREELGEDLALFSGSTFMQTKYWAEFKAEFGFSPLYLKIAMETGESSGLLVLLRPIIKGFSLAYIPHGPSLELSAPKTLEKISKELKKVLPNKTLFIRYDLLSGTTGDDFPKKLKGKLIKSLSPIQVPDTTILDLTSSEDDLLNNMHKKTRYNIKLAAKKGVAIREAKYEDIENWYEMYEVTAKRDGIAIHSLDYYKSVYKKATEYKEVDMKLLFAEHEGDLLAGIFILICGDSSTYVYGASANSKRNLMPAYLLQWEAIKLAKNSGATSYDFFGIPPINDKNHPMYGLYRFKAGFGGEIIHRHGCYDYALSFLYYPLRLIEKIRTFYFKRIRR